MDNHELLIPKLWNAVGNNGALAAQIPVFENMPINTVINNIVNKHQYSRLSRKNYSLCLIPKTAALSMNIR
jgi:trans-aconitate methyltransferase